MFKLKLKSIFKPLLLGILAAGLLTAPALAAYSYYANYTITNSGNTTYSMLPIIVSSNNLWMSQQGFMSATANDTRVETIGGSVKPHLVTDNRTLTAVVVPAISQTNLRFTTGNTDLDSMKIITGFSGNVTAADADNLELSDNFSVSMSGWIDTANGSDKNLVNKDAAFKIFVSPTVSENITASIFSFLDWVDPTGNVANGWTSPTDAYDNNIGSFATYSISSAAWSPFLELTRASTNITQFRYYAGGNNVAINQIDVDAYYNSQWNNVYQGAFTQDIYETKIVASLDVTSIKISLYNSGGIAYVGYINDFDYGEGSYSPSVTATDVSSNVHTITTQMDSPFLSLGIDATSPVYPVTSSGLVLNAPLWQTECDEAIFTTIDDNEFTANVTGATWGTQGRTFDGIDDYINIPNHPSLIFGTGNFTIEVWASLVALPTDSAPCMVTKGTSGAGEWMLRFDEANTRTGFYADAGAINFFDAGATDIRGAGYQHIALCRQGTNAYLYLNAVQVGTQAGIGAIDLDTTTDLRLSAGVAGRDWHGPIGEVRIYNRALTPGEIKYNYLATKSKYVGGDIYTYSTLTSVANTTNNWTFMQNNVMPYADNISMSVNGTRQLYFAPTSIIIGTNLPDRETTTNNDGIFHWGSNPAYVSSLLGSLTSSAQPSPGAGLEEPTRSVLPPTETSDWFVEPDVGVGSKLETFPLRPFVTLMSDTGKISEIQAWMFLALAVILLVTVGTASAVRGHLIITGVAAGAAMGACIALTIFPLWTLVFAIGAVVGGAIAERSPSL